MAGGMTLLVDEMRYQRFSKKAVTCRHQSGRAGIELRPRWKLGRLRQEYGLQVAAEGAFGRAGVASRTERWNWTVCGREPVMDVPN